MKITDSLLVTYLKQGDENAYKYLYDHYYNLLCNIANELLKNSFQSENIVNDTILHVWEIRHSLDISSSILAYLIKAVRNRCINQIKSDYTKKETLLLDFQNADIVTNKYIISTEHPLGLLLEQELEEKINNSIDQLPEETKKVFKKSRFDGQKQEDIAIELDISINTVKYHIKKALAFLKDDLGKYLVLFLTFFL